MSLVMDDNQFGAAPFFFSDLSTGYLEDALVEFGSKRRRLMLYGDECSWNSNLNLISPSPESRNSEEEAIVTFAEVKSRSIDHSSNANKIDEAVMNKTRTRVAYPFALVKPGGAEGDVTLDDINRRILMPPSRPVRHPVGDFACRPRISPGISGKVVVALTTIQTSGRGTITIIRTKG